MSGLCEARHTEHAGNALFSTADIAADSLLAHFDVYLTARVALQDTQLRRYLVAHEDIVPFLYGNEKLILTLYIALHADDGPSSGLIDTDVLPKDIQNGVWTTSQHEAMKLTALWPAILAKRTVLQRQWQALAQDVCTFDTWKWADSIISSRCIGLAQAPGLVSLITENDEFNQMLGLDQPDLCLVPMLDLCNHAGLDRNARWEVDDHGIQLLTTRDITKDEEITISYGDEKSNDELFFNYGFIVPDNSNWQVSIALSAPEGAEDNYWHNVMNTYGLSNMIRLISNDLTKETQASSKIIRAWKMMSNGMVLTDGNLGALLLSSSMDVAGSNTLVDLFSADERLTKDEIEACALVAKQALLAALGAALADAETRLATANVSASSVAINLISQEKRGLSILLDTLRGDAA